MRNAFMKSVKLIANIPFYCRIAAGRKVFPNRNSVAVLTFVIIAWALISTILLPLSRHSSPSLSLLYYHQFSANYHNSEQQFYVKKHPHNCADLFNLKPLKQSTTIKNNGDNKNANKDKEPKKEEVKIDSAMYVEKDYALWKVYSDCQQVRGRFFYPEKPNSEAEANFPLAYSIVVYRDLQHIELLLSAIYAPQNTYCFHIDLKATQVFSHGLRRLASCFPNVIIADDQYSVSSSGMNMIRAYRSCFAALTAAVENSQWKYVFTLQGQDFPLRTNRELVEVAQILDGANDVELLHASAGRWEKRYELTYDDNGVLLDVNSAKEITVSKNNFPTSESMPGLTFYKGSVSATLSRAFVEFTLSNEKASKLVEWLDNTVLSDELYWATLNHDEELRAPGGYPGRCYSIGRKDWLTRFTVWQDYTGATCSGSWRHAVCVFGLGDLPKLAKRPELFLNKFSTQSDPLPTFCMHELLYNRTYLPHTYDDIVIDGNVELLSSAFGFNKTWYEASAPVIFHKWSSQQQSPPLPSSSSPQPSSSQNFTCVQCLFNCEH